MGKKEGGAGRARQEEVVAVHSVKQNGEVLSDLQFFNEGSGLSLDLGRGCLQLWAVADLACSALEPSPLVGK